jgi:hypothetical protein
MAYKTVDGKKVDLSPQEEAQFLSDQQISFDQTRENQRILDDTPTVDKVLKRIEQLEAKLAIR